MQVMWQEPPVWSLGQEDPPQKEMATHSSFLAWEIPWTEEPGGLQSRGSQKSQTILQILCSHVTGCCEVDRLSEDVSRGPPGGPAAESPPSSAGDVGLIPGRRTKTPHAVGQLSLCLATTEPAHSRTCAPGQEEPEPQWRPRLAKKKRLTRQNLWMWSHLKKESLRVQ